MKENIQQMIEKGTCAVEVKEEMLLCSFLKEVGFSVPMPASGGTDAIIDNIVQVLMHPAAFGISRECIDSVRTPLIFDGRFFLCVIQHHN